MILVCFIDVVVILLFIRLSVVIAYILYTSLTRAEYSWTCNSKMFMTTRNIPNQALIHVLISKFWSPCQLTVGIKYELSILTMSCNCLFIQIYIAHIEKKWHGYETLPPWYHTCMLHFHNIYKLKCEEVWMAMHKKCANNLQRSAALLHILEVYFLKQVGNSQGWLWR